MVKHLPNMNEIWNISDFGFSDSGHSTFTLDTHFCTDEGGEHLKKPRGH